MKNILLFIALGFMACNQSIDLPHVDELAWKNDKNGCELVRATLIEGIEQDKDLLKGLSQDDVIGVLGKPDQNELFKRNQKFFIYNITPYDCDKSVNKISRKYLSIRFNATGLAKEIIIYTE